MARFSELLRAHVPDFDRRYVRILEKLAALDRVPATVIHGDLFGENILVDEAVHPIAVLDFGFLSTAGDPRLDASISAVIMNMYGPHAPAIARTLTDRLAAEPVFRAELAGAARPPWTPDADPREQALSACYQFLLGAAGALAAPAGQVMEGWT